MASKNTRPLDMPPPDTEARPADSYRGARRNAAKAYAKANDRKFSEVWPTRQFRTFGKAAKK